VKIQAMVIQELEEYKRIPIIILIFGLIKMKVHIMGIKKI
jgi:hypothetical protein